MIENSKSVYRSFSRKRDIVHSSPLRRQHTTYSSSSKSTSLLSMALDGLLAGLSEEDDITRRRFCW